MDKILTVRQPWASALVHGLKHFEYRSWKIPAGQRIWIHAGLSSGMTIEQASEFLRLAGDGVAAAYLLWMQGKDDSPRPPIERSRLAQSMYEASGRHKTAFPYGLVVGWCIFGEAIETPKDAPESTFGRFANPVNEYRPLNPEGWRIHKGSLGLMPYTYQGATP